jgi:phospholipase/carboxylesterase
VTDPLITRLRPAQRPTTTGHLIVLLHGLGSDENDLLGLADYLPETAHVATLRAPLPYGAQGYRWFDLSFPGGRIVYAHEEALASMELIHDRVQSLQEELDCPPASTVLGGFSQGAVMSFAALAKYPTLARSGLLMSGALLPDIVSETSDALRGVQFLVQHGSFDPVLPIIFGRTLRDYLLEESIPHMYKEYPMQHEISRESLGDLSAWLAQVF